MKITFLLTQSLESPSGLGRYWPLAKELARLGHSVNVLALHHDIGTIKHRCFIEDGVKIYYVGQMHVRKLGNYKLYFSPIQLLCISMLATLQLARAALRMQADIYHVCKPHPMNGLAGLVTKVVKRKNVFLDCDDYEAFSNRFAGHWQQQIIAWFENYLPNFAVGITTNTRFMVRRLESLGYPANRIIYVPNGVDQDRFSSINEAEVEVLRERLGLSTNKVVLYIGTMSLSNHAVDLLIEAFGIVHQAERIASLILVGGGEDYELLKSKVVSLGLGSCTLFVGKVPSNQAPLYYRLADVSVDPVHDDLVARARSPLKIVESLAAGVPIVTGNVGDRYELLGGGCAGKLVVPGDARALALGILEVIENPMTALEMVRSAKSLRTKYYWDVLVKDFIQVYELVKP